MRQPAVARSRLGVCPQFDAMGQMTVLEHLVFYARIRSVPDITHNVREVIRAVGLTPFKHRMATKPSGGNKRKLSLGIALMGNPSVLLHFTEACRPTCLRQNKGPLTMSKKRTPLRVQK
ncbi:hypothetical protein BDV18DRAFT_160823 [Aspergillus unguis]